MDDAPSCPATKVEDLWFPDGTLVICAGQKLFKVSKFVLVARSGVFRDMVALPPKPDDDLYDDFFATGLAAVTAVPTVGGPWLEHPACCVARRPTSGSKSPLLKSMLHFNVSAFTDPLFQSSLQFTVRDSTNPLYPLLLHYLTILRILSAMTGLTDSYLLPFFMCTNLHALET
ncbi:hypothetical protein C8F01DRAFT_1266789 [Mycena amicta]|nr:hypothetical protein C8F01DRAFT_1266789 [Mycena amicta]